MERKNEKMAIFFSSAAVEATTAKKEALKTEILRSQSALVFYPN